MKTALFCGAKFASLAEFKESRPVIEKEYNRVAQGLSCLGLIACTILAAC